MKKKLRTKILKPGIITTYFYLSIGEWKDAQKWYLKHGFSKIENFQDDAGAMTSHHPTDNAIGIWFAPEVMMQKKSRTVNWIAHECCHATWKTEMKIGDWFNGDVQEPQCYLLGWLAGECYDFIYSGDKKQRRK